FNQPDVGTRPGRFTDPAAGPFPVHGLRWHAFLQPGPQLRFVHDARLFAFEPPVPEAERFLQETDGRAGHTEVRVQVPPGANQAEARTAQVFEQAGNGVRVRVCPAADGEHGTGHGGEVFADRTVLPVRVTRLVFQPRLKPETLLFEP